MLDLTTGSAGFLISAMEMMIDDVEKTYTRGSTDFKNKVKNIKSNQLFGVEKNANMYTLAATNMILFEGHKKIIEYKDMLNYKRKSNLMSDELFQ